MSRNKVRIDRLMILVGLSLWVSMIARAQENCPSNQIVASADDLKSTITQSEAKLDTLKRQNPQSDETPEIRTTEENLLTATYQLECQEESRTLGSKGLWDQASFVQVPILYITDRRRAEPHSGDYIYGPNANGALTFGRVDVTINEIGSIRVGMILGTKRVGKPASMGEAQVQAHDPMSESAFLELIGASHPAGVPVRVLLFVHGFNVKFYEAALSAARLATSMQVPLVPIVYSWPSRGDVLGYWHDEDEVSAAVIRFLPLLQKLVALPNSQVEIVCHSMGARVVTRALSELARRNVGFGSLKNVAFAAGDISVEEFGAQWPSLKQIPGVEWASYESSGDLALRLSTYIHRFRRLGESDGMPFLEDGLESIDASATTSVIRTLGHSYVTSSPAVAADLGDWIVQGLPPAVRGLQRIPEPGGIVWKFP